MNSFLAYIKKRYAEPTTKTGVLTGIFTIIVDVIQYFIFHIVPTETTIIGSLLSISLIIIKDNTITIEQLEKAIADTISAIRSPTESNIKPAAADDIQIVTAIIEGLKK